MTAKILRYAGLGLEGTFGTAVDATQHLDIISASLDSPNDPLLHYAGGLGRARRVVRPGFYSPEGNIVYAVDIETITQILRATLGGYVFTDGGTSPNIHEFYGEDNSLLKSLTARIGKDLYEHVFSGCIVNSFQLEVNDEWAQVTVDLRAQKDAKGTIQDIGDLSLSAEYPLAFHELTVSSGLVSAKVRSLTLNIENNADASGGQGPGSRHPHRIPVGDRTVSATIGLWYDDTDELERFWGGASEPADGGPTEFALKLTLDGDGEKEMEIDLPKCIYDSVNHQPSGRDRMDEEVSVVALLNEDTALADTTTLVDTEILVTVKNSQTTLA